MIDLRCGPRLALLCLMLLPMAAPAGQETEIVVGYVEMQDDPRHDAGAEQAGIAFRDTGRPRIGAEMGIADANAIGRLMGLAFRLDARRVPEAALAEAVRGMQAEGAGVVLADLPAPQLVALADAVAETGVLILNVSARDDALRGAGCRANLAHAIPSDSMRADALVQYLATRNWKDILVLQGPAEADARFADALERAARKFGVRVEDRRRFELTADPRRRDRSNVALMTGDSDADVVFVADESREFARYVPYRTLTPMPVVGDAGLRPVAWHWSWDRYGAPQVQHRLEALAPPRRMDGPAWAAWVAVKAVTQAALRRDPADPAAMRAYILGPELNLDGSKGHQMQFRPWNRQLRQPILLATAEATIAMAPFDAFLHPRNDLDTLGLDAAESDCAR